MHTRVQIAYINIQSCMAVHSFNLIVITQRTQAYVDIGTKRLALVPVKFAYLCAICLHTFICVLQFELRRLNSASYNYFENDSNWFPQVLSTNEMRNEQPLIEIQEWRKS